MSGSFFNEKNKKMYNSSFLQENLFLNLKEDIDFFKSFIVFHYEKSLNGIGLVGTLREDRLRDAYDLWSNDMDRAERYDLPGSLPDHLKNAGHLCYWLRRNKVLDWIG
ncbi:MAG: hypothetical protein ABJP82_14815, partial [Hyphomicrobiales bacterium]